MTETDLVNLLRTNTHMGRLAGGEVRHALEYMRSIGCHIPVNGDDAPDAAPPANPEEGPTIGQWIPVGYASRSTQDEIDAAIYAEMAAEEAMKRAKKEKPVGR